jgi:hypothetical protein
VHREEGDVEAGKYDPEGEFAPEFADPAAKDQRNQ